MDWGNAYWAAGGIVAGMGLLAVAVVAGRILDEAAAATDPIDLVGVDAYRTFNNHWLVELRWAGGAHSHGGGDTYLDAFQDALTSRLGQEVARVG